MAAKGYRLKVFTPHEFATMTVLSETILRNNEMSGAGEAKVNQFIDFQLTHDPEMLKRFRAGLKWMDMNARLHYGADFREIKAEQRQEMIAALDIKSLHRAGEERGRGFFELARRYTYMGFYASKDALKRYIPPAKPLNMIGPTSSLATSGNGSNSESEE